MMTELLRSSTILLFWLLAFGVMLVIDICAIAVACYMLKQFGEEWAGTVERGRRRHGYQLQVKEHEPTFKEF